MMDEALEGTIHLYFTLLRTCLALAIVLASSPTLTQTLPLPIFATLTRTRLVHHYS